MEKNYNLYELIDPRNNIPFYIGITNRPLKTRLMEHYKPTQYRKSPKKRKIIGAIKREFLKIKINPIFEDLTFEEALEYEYQMIWKLKAAGYELANVSEGGNLYIPTKEAREKISKKLQGRKWSDSQRENSKDRKRSFKPIIVTEISSNKEIRFESLLAAERFFNISKQQICNVLKGRNYSFYNKKYKARYEEIL